MTETVDSTKDTLVHIKRVSELLMSCCVILMNRAAVHDNSKLVEPEKSSFDKATILHNLEYGTPEYFKSLEDLKPALEHHYAKNSHHPQHYEDGINGMNLFDLIEMFYDWRASSERHSTGNICKSIKINSERFEMSGQLTSIFTNTVKHLGW